ncbi:MAG: beta-ketoacyl synthase N-terminal-like domain-containing protein [Nitrosomonas sp.]
MRRVVITGLGIVSPTGVGIETAWRNALSGASCVGKIVRFDTSSLPVHIAAEANDFDGVALLGGKKARQTSRFIQFAEVAAQETLRDAGYDASAHGQCCGCIIGVAIGGIGRNRGQCSHTQGTRIYQNPATYTPLFATQHGIGRSGY